jgi:hypothetical protein
VVIDHLNIIRTRIVPSEANSPLVINANAPLAFSIADKLFEPISGRTSQVSDDAGSVEHIQLSQDHSHDAGPLRRTFSGFEKMPRAGILEGLDHSILQNYNSIGSFRSPSINRVGYVLRIAYQTLCQME